MLLHSLCATNHPQKPLKLIIWEPAEITGDRLKPFYFKTNYLCENLTEAMQILAQIQQSSRELLQTACHI